MLRKVYEKVLCLRLRFHSALQLRHVCKGGNCNVFGKISIINPKRLKIGDDCSFNHGAYINAFNPITFGNDVTVSAGVKVISTGIDYQSWVAGKKRHTQSSGIKIGDHVWIGADAKILDGVSISGKFVVIAAGAVVTENITEDFVAVGGCPAKIIKRYL